jgi:CheY-like chemotaxis protein
MNQWRVLVVEDDPFSQDVASTILQYHGAHVDVAGSGEEAIFMLSENAYDVLVVDLSLPEMDGWSVLRYVRHHPQLAAIPCFAVTAYHSAAVAQEAIAAGFRAFFPKPLHAETFVQDLTTYL